MSLLCALSRLTLRVNSTRGICTTPTTWMQLSPVLCAEPLKKKKKLDPQIIKHREDRKKKKIEKQIRRLEKNARQLKPVQELEVPIDLLDQKDKRLRQIDPPAMEELERRAQLNKQWAQYKHNENVADFQIIDRLMQSQQKALEELRSESEELYQEAIQCDVTLLPVSVKGPVSTPPIEGYISPDGDYIHKTKSWE